MQFSAWKCFWVLTHLPVLRVSRTDPNSNTLFPETWTASTLVTNGQSAQKLEKIATKNTILDKHEGQRIPGEGLAGSWRARAIWLQEKSIISFCSYGMKVRGFMSYIYFILFLGGKVFFFLAVFASLCAKIQAIAQTSVSFSAIVSVFIGETVVIGSRGQFLTKKN